MGLNGLSKLQEYRIMFDVLIGASSNEQPGGEIVGKLLSTSVCRRLLAYRGPRRRVGDANRVHSVAVVLRGRKGGDGSLKNIAAVRTEL